MREDNQDGESLAGLSLKDFEDRWWNRLVQTGVLKKDGPKLPSVKPNYATHFDEWIYFLLLRVTMW